MQTETRWFAMVILILMQLMNDENICIISIDGCSETTRFVFQTSKMLYQNHRKFSQMRPFLSSRRPKILVLNFARVIAQPYIQNKSDKNDAAN